MEINESIKPITIHEFNHLSNPKGRYFVKGRMKSLQKLCAKNNFSMIGTMSDDNGYTMELIFKSQHIVEILGMDLHQFSTLAKSDRVAATKVW
jgi:translation elongation factor P/translation initiation factor 5A